MILKNLNESGMFWYPEKMEFLNLRILCVHQVLMCRLTFRLILFLLKEQQIILKLKVRDKRIKNLNCFVISNVNINSIRNKLEDLAEAVMGNADILMVIETKID